MYVSLFSRIYMNMHVCNQTRVKEPAKVSIKRGCLRKRLLNYDSGKRTELQHVNILSDR